MKLLTIASTLALLAAPALAWDPPAATSTTTNNGGAGGAGGTGGAGGHAAASSRATSQSRSTATGGASNVQASGNNVSIGGNVGGSGSGGGNRAPDVYISPGFASGADCPTVGFGAGGSGLGGSGGFGPSWISPDCNKRKVAALLSELYGPAVARAYAEENIDGVRTAVAATAPPPAPVVMPRVKPDVCVGAGTWTAGELKRHPECQG